MSTGIGRVLSYTPPALKTEHHATLSAAVTSLTTPGGKDIFTWTAKKDGTYLIDIEWGVAMDFNVTTAPTTFASYTKDCNAVIEVTLVEYNHSNVIQNVYYIFSTDTVYPPFEVGSAYASYVHQQTSVPVTTTSGHYYVVNIAVTDPGIVGTFTAQASTTLNSLTVWKYA